MSERLHKLLAQHGFGSRREIEKWILEGRVLLNGRAAQAGDRYSSGDRVAIDGRDVSGRLKVSAAPDVIIYHKLQGQPIGAGSEDSASGKEAASGKSVMESLPSVRGARWLVVNTMQAGDSGLMLLTSDGSLANALRRRAETIPAAYVARVLVPTPEFDATTLPLVVNYDNERIEFESIEPAGGEGTNRWFRVETRRAHRRAAVRALVREPRLESEPRDPGAVRGHRAAARSAARPASCAVAGSDRSALCARGTGAAATRAASARQQAEEAAPAA